MAVTWYKTNFLGVRYREHATRKHGIRPDRCFSIRYKVNGKDKEEVVGWSSEKMSAEKAFRMLSEIRENIKKGSGPKSIADMRRENEEQAEREATARRLKEKNEITFADFWEAEYLPAARATKKANTVENERLLYSKWVAPALGDIPLQKIDIGRVEAVMFHAQKSGKSAATIRHILAIVSQVWRKAVDRNFVSGDCPTRRIKKPRKDNRRMRFLTREEARALLDALKKRSKDVYQEALLSLLTGLRAGEIHALTWGDIDWQHGLIVVRDPKNKNNRHAFITAEIKEVFEGRYKGQATTELIFPDANGSVRRWVSDTFSRTVDELGFNDSGEFTMNDEGERIPVKIADSRQRVVFHTLRHTFASWLVQRGIDLYKVKELMGHSDLKMTQRYSHLAPDSLREVAMVLQGNLEQPSAKVLPFQAKG